ncbi:hypothetical protein [Limnobaculum xujianqingii]|nr:hypothetical protein [Limnobaculum xujianqingii]
MNRNKYITTIVNGHEIKFKGCYKYSLLFWEMLEDLNYISIKRGQRSYTKICYSYITLLEPLIELLTPYLKNVNLLPLNNCIILRDKEKNTVNYKRCKLIRHKINLINNYNKLLLNTSVNEISTNSDFCIQFHRIYNTNFEKGGRYYEHNGLVQCMKSSLRRNILINGQETVEVDFKSLHPRLIYTASGIDLADDFDPYAISPILFGLSDTPEVRKQLRRLAKFGLLILINASNYHKSRGALDKEFNEAKIEGEFDLLPDDLCIRTVINALKKVNPNIAKCFHTGLGSLLQCHDSDIAELIIQHFTDKNIPIIPIHDSFIIAKEFEHEMHDVMKSSYKCIMKTSSNCIVETK